MAGRRRAAGLLVLFTLLHIGLALDGEGLVAPLHQERDVKSAQVANRARHIAVGEAVRATEGAVPAKSDYALSMHVPDVMSKVQDTVTRIKQAADDAIAKTEADASEMQGKQAAKLKDAIDSGKAKISQVETDAKSSVQNEADIQKAANSDEKAIKTSSKNQIKEVEDGGRAEISKLADKVGAALTQKREIDEAVGAQRAVFESKQTTMNDERDAKLLEIKTATESAVGASNEIKEKGVAKLTLLKEEHAEYKNKASVRIDEKKEKLSMQIQEQEQLATQSQEKASELTEKEQAARDSAEAAKVYAQTLLQHASMASESYTKENQQKLDSSTVNEATEKSGAADVAQANANSNAAQDAANVASGEASGAVSAAAAANAAASAAGQTVTHTSVMLASTTGAQNLADSEASEADAEVVSSENQLSIAEATTGADAAAATNDVAITGMSTAALLSSTDAAVEAHNEGVLEMQAQGATTSANQAQNQAQTLSALAVQQHADAQADAAAAQGMLNSAQGMLPGAQNAVMQAQQAATTVQGGVVAAQQGAATAASAVNTAESTASSAHNTVAADDAAISSAAAAVSSAGSSVQSTSNKAAASEDAAASVAADAASAEENANTALAAATEASTQARNAQNADIQAHAIATQDAGLAAGQQGDLSAAQGTSASDGSFVSRKAAAEAAMRGEAAKAELEKESMEQALDQVKTQQEIMADNVAKLTEEKVKTGNFEESSMVTAEMHQQAAESSALMEAAKYKLNVTQTALAEEMSQQVLSSVKAAEAAAAKQLADEEAQAEKLAADKASKDAEKARLQVQMASEDGLEAETEVEKAQDEAKAAEQDMASKTVAVAVTTGNRKSAHQHVDETMAHQVQILRRASTVAEMAVKKSTETYDDAVTAKDEGDSQLSELEAAMEDAQDTANGSPENDVAQEAAQQAEAAVDDKRSDVQDLMAAMATAKLAKDGAEADAKKVTDALDAYEATMGDRATDPPTETATNLLSLGDAEDDDADMATLDAQDRSPF